MAFPKINLSSFQRRALSALIGAPLFLIAIKNGEWPLLLILGCAFCISVYEWYRLATKTGHFAMYMLTGIIYMLCAYAAFYGLRELYSTNVVLLFIGMIWFSDTAAYFTGKLLGGPKLIVKISPNKTWSGFGGAIFFPGLFAVLWVALFGFHENFNDLPWYDLYPVAFATGVCIGSIGQAGDLIVSFVKRRAKVKDTGSLIPGHGGILDRIDSMMLGAPVFFVLLEVLSYVL
ncbi:MAG: phosphatidate cytidylyltransferase [Alphaproteobacteria bacterium]|nr:phosphatidate cytidylyltransferase [Alphaproteobacteria bacterium]